MPILTVNETRNASVIMANGATVPIRGGWTYIAAGEGAAPELIQYDRGEELWFTSWEGEVAGFHVADLADGEAWDDLEGATVSRRGDNYTVSDGTIWARYGDEMIVWTPPRRIAKAA